MTFITSPNQRKITIHKCDPKKNYSKIATEANKAAMRDLGYSAYMLYMYLCMNASNFNFILSKVAACADTGLSKNVYYTAFHKLIDKGYLVPKPNTQCLFDFYESPDLMSLRPKTGKKATQTRESTVQKQVENIKKNIENNVRGDAIAPPPDEENETKKSIAGRTRKRLFADM